MHPRRTALRLLSITSSVLFGASCANVPDAEVDAPQPVIGTTTTEGCTTNEQLFGLRAIEAARVVAVSRALQECVSATMASTQSLQRYGSTVATGPYRVQSGDPFGTAPLTTQTWNALYAAASRADVRLVCSSSGGLFGHAQVGMWQQNRQAPEVIWMDQSWRDFLPLDNGANAGTADFYQASRRRAANTIWHEVMHTWGYTHQDATINQSVPRILGHCMETVMQRSATCTNVCGTGQRAVRRYGSTLCECVDDPQFDVGVILDAGETCPVPAGRAAASSLELTMDDEDSNNKNTRGGWIGQTTSTTNTTFRFCAVPGSGFRRRLVSVGTTTLGHYAVARMGASCPPGSVPFGRYFDNEDGGNANRSVGHVPPHRSDQNTKVQFCMFRNDTAGSSAPFPDLGRRYGVFAGASFPGALATGYVYTDDEDSNNANGIDGSYNGSEAFLTAGPNTALRIARVR